MDYAPLRSPEPEAELPQLGPATPIRLPNAIELAERSTDQRNRKRQDEHRPRRRQSNQPARTFEASVRPVESTGPGNRKQAMAKG